MLGAAAAAHPRTAARAHPVACEQLFGKRSLPAAFTGCTKAAALTGRAVVLTYRNPETHRGTAENNDVTTK